MRTSDQTIPGHHLRHRLGGYDEYVAPRALHECAESVWTYITPPTAGASGATHRVLPDPALNIAFSTRRDADGRVDDPRLVIIGPKTRPHLTTFDPGREFTAVKLKLEWVTPVLGIRHTEHEDVIHDLALASPRIAEPLFDRLVTTRTAAEAMAMLEAAMSACAIAAHEAWAPTPAAAAALDLARATRGMLGVDDLAERVGVSVRQLRRVVTSRSAISLKGYARTLRLLHAVTAADVMEKPPWARVAADAGYCDQSHLVRECRALCNLSPGDVHRERRAEATEAS